MLLIGSIAVWGSVVVFIMAYFGAGAWFYNGAQDAAPPARPDPARRDAAPAKPRAAIPEGPRRRPPAEARRSAGDRLKSKGARRA